MGEISSFVLVLSFFFYGTNVLAKKSELGELPKNNYYGPHLPLFKVDRTNNNYISEDDYFEKWYFQSKMEKEFFILDEYFSGEFLNAHYCPESFIAKYEEYYRYLVRLLTISYIYEANKEYLFTAKQMGYENTCRIDWVKTFNTCKPKSNEMKGFVNNVKHFFPNIKEQIVPFELTKHAQKQDWLDKFNRGKVENLTQARLFVWMDSQKDKTDASIANLQKKLQSICDEDKKMLVKICTEEDSLYGLSSYLEVYSLLSRSNAMSWMEPTEYQLGCLRRYIKENASKEVRFSPFESIFSFIYSKKIQLKAAFEQGDLFIYGAFKEFIDKGLKEIFAKKSVVRPVKQEVKIVKDVPPKIEEINLPLVRKNKSKTSSKIVVTAKENMQRQTSFKSASDLRAVEDLDEVYVDMEKFHFDYVFTREQQARFDSFVIKFSSQKSLREMKKDDGLGLKKAPIPLKFLKYLIDKEMHKGLFNIIHVLGEKFFVLNDIDPGNELSFVSLHNAKETGFKWQLRIIRP